MWFDVLTGFSESTAKVYSHFSVKDGQLQNNLTGINLSCGQLTTPQLSELRHSVASLPAATLGSLSVSERVADVQALHCDPTNAGSLFQVASQFNLLEMISPDVSPEQGISIYQYDRTQGPACAIACGAGTIYRNYFVEVAGEIQAGQTRTRQLDMLADVGNALGNIDAKLWRMQNGYMLPSREGLQAIDSHLSRCSEAQLDELRALLRIGVQANTQVTLPNCQHLVTQAYCSALPVAYCYLGSRLWARFATLVLEAAYEATLAAAVLNATNNGNNTVFLTLLGGGAFGNKTDWIMSAIGRALRLYQHTALEVQIVSYGSSKAEVRQLIAEFGNQTDNNRALHD